MVVRGAPAIGCAAAYGIAMEAARMTDGTGMADYADHLEQAFTTLADSRPTAVNLFWALNKMRARWQEAREHSIVHIADTLLQEAMHIHADDVRINKQLGEHGADLLGGDACVLTHCNAGALATAGHGTALGIIRSAVCRGYKISVVADETRPWLQGARLTAWEMVQENIPVTLIADSAAGHLMSTGTIDAVLVGADRVAANGDVANKIGTYGIAVLAARHDIPFYVACPGSTIDPDTADGTAIPVEEREASEVTGYNGARWAAEGVQVRNPAFDITPADLVTALITEHGVVQAPCRQRIAELLAEHHAAGREPMEKPEKPR